MSKELIERLKWRFQIRNAMKLAQMTDAEIDKTLVLIGAAEVMKK